MKLYIWFEVDDVGEGNWHPGGPFLVAINVPTTSLTMRLKTSMVSCSCIPFGLTTPNPVRKVNPTCLNTPPQQH